MLGKISGLVFAAWFFAGAALAQTAVNVSINSTYSNINSVKPIEPDFAGLGFEITSEMPGANGLPPGVHRALRTHLCSSHLPPVDGQIELFGQICDIGAAAGSS